VTLNKHAVLVTVNPSLAAKDRVVSANIIEYAKFAKPAINTTVNGTKKETCLNSLLF
jgi:hypothetical protein